MVFKLLGRAPKCPRGCLRSPYGDEGMEGWSVCPQTEQLPLVAVLCIGVQGKILFVVRALLLKKVRKPLTRPSAPSGACVPPHTGKTLCSTLPTGHLPKVAFLGPQTGAAGTRVRLPTCSARKPSARWKEGLCYDRLKSWSWSRFPEA